MRIYLLSDLHLEFQDFSPATHDADVVVLAGDIDLLTRGVEWANKNFRCPVIYVAGNHEFYKGHLNRTLEKMREKALPHVHVLDNDEVVIDGVRFLGTTGWTDFSSTDNVTTALHTAQISMNDYKQIRMGANYRRIKPIDLQQKSQFAKQWLLSNLSTKYQGKTVVVTHHAPLPECAPGIKYELGHLAAAYVNDWQEFAGCNIDIWLHGHTHVGYDKTIEGIRYASNPRGYPFEETGFVSDLVLTI
ncbi:Ser/Thr protein phosphatase family protein [Pseudomonas chlororaphis]|uniref:Ser/Thr protein phosphatase family protein n=1 Tax=Pseudomonas chlororaphis TaxID=587753 RepID=A0A3G7TLK6_9PSED|nr:metallophosphoesterase [Pseudomonas chlororaphis]AZE47219.1 Ser/Thr protein phosphatase family protein [Pseudomonas chlororaphis]